MAAEHRERVDPMIKMNHCAELHSTGQPIDRVASSMPECPLEAALCV